MLKHVFLSVIALGLTQAGLGQAHAQSQAHISKAQAGKSCTGCNLFQLDLNYQSFSKLSFSKSRIRQSQMVVATMDDVDFSGRNMSVSVLSASRFRRCKLRRNGPYRLFAGRQLVWRRKLQGRKPLRGKSLGRNDENVKRPDTKPAEQGLWRCIDRAAKWVICATVLSS